MFWLFYILIFIGGLLVFRHFVSVRLDQIASNRFIRNKIQYEMNQDISNMYHGRSSVESFIPSYDYLSITSAMISGQIGNSWMDENSHFINSLENMMRFLALMKDFQYMLDIDKSVYFSNINHRVMRKTFVTLLRHVKEFHNQSLTYIRISCLEEHLFIEIEDTIGVSKSITIK